MCGNITMTECSLFLLLGMFLLCVTLLLVFLLLGMFLLGVTGCDVSSLCDWFFFSPGFWAQGRRPGPARKEYTRVPPTQPVRHDVVDVQFGYASMSVCERVIV